MTQREKEPGIRVGLIDGASSVSFTLSGRFQTANGSPISDGNYVASLRNGLIKLEGESPDESPAITLYPTNFDTCRFVVHDVTIGIDFHWQRRESQTFQGVLSLIAGVGGLVVINELPLESYLVSVISSEMSASCPPDLLRAHSIVSRSWLLAQLERPGRRPGSPQMNNATAHAFDEVTEERIKWYDRENHDAFDVCADDHCQRYQGISKAFSEAAFRASGDTRGVVLVWDDEICDARYSKSCGGMTELYRAAWEDKDVPYLQAVYDGAAMPGDYGLPLSREDNAIAWISSSPAAYCNAISPGLLGRILPGFDQETRDYYRWEVSYTQQEISSIFRSRLGIEFGRVLALEAIERGESARIVKLRIRGENRSLVIGKELEIRRALSRSHLYSSAFIVEAGADADGYPEHFRLIGAGWGHGVGLCQIGAAVMADLGHQHGEILAHYFPGAELRKLY